jgi:phenylpropionate dioxygenase-like ring-hydroxylating dioxygenase large terminal subunit
MTAVQPQLARTALQNALADFTTPLLYDHWYVACLKNDLTDRLIERTFLNRSVVMYRTAEGKPVALQNRCAHRSFPLSESWLEEDGIRCRYHGAKYNHSGEMTDVPCQDVCPQIKLRTYPLFEIGPLVWIWMGDPERIDWSRLPETPWMIPENGWELAAGSTSVDGNYLLMMENLMDLSHIPYLHRDTFNFPPSYARIPVQLETNGNGLRYFRTAIANYHRSGFFPSDLAAKFDGRSYDVSSGGEFVAPGMMFGHGEIRLRDGLPGEQVEYLSRIPHFVTPKTQHTSHYWFFHSRNFSLEDHEFTQRLAKVLEKGFSEDKTAIAWMQELQLRDGHSYREIHYGTDKPTVTMRRIIKRLADEEYGSTIASQQAETLSNNRVA